MTQVSYKPDMTDRYNAQVAANGGQPEGLPSPTQKARELAEEQEAARAATKALPVVEGDDRPAALGGTRRETVAEVCERLGGFTPGGQDGKSCARCGRREALHEERPGDAAG